MKKKLSKFIFEKISGFIKDKLFILKLVAYSKLNQEKLNIKLIDYNRLYLVKKKYLLKII